VLGERWVYFLAIALLLVMGYELHAMRASVEVLIRDRSEPAQRAASNWREINGVSRTISTYRLVGEHQDDFIHRHEAATRAMIEELSKTPDSERTERR